MPEERVELARTTWWQWVAVAFLVAAVIYPGAYFKYYSGRIEAAVSQKDYARLLDVLGTAKLSDFSYRPWMIRTATVIGRGDDCCKLIELCIEQIARCPVENLRSMQTTAEFVIVLYDLQPTCQALDPAELRQRFAHFKREDSTELDGLCERLIHRAQRTLKKQGEDSNPS